MLELQAELGLRPGLVPGGHFWSFDRESETAILGARGTARRDVYLARERI